MKNGRVSDHRVFYRIRVKGMLDVSWSDWFDGFTIDPGEDETRLSGFVEDQAALFGTLTKLNNLGLILMAVNLVDEVSP